jgi:hypothetical protein
MKCKLCLQEKPLIRKSHLIPNFMYKGMFGKNKKLIETNIFNLKQQRQRQTGYYQEAILCAKCDNNIIGGYESYASQILYLKSDIEHEIYEHGGIENVLLKGIDYTKFKLFLLSILWRSSISNLDFFKNINLGSKYSELARKMIFEGNPMNTETFPVSIFSLENSVKSRVPSKAIIEPVLLKENGNYSYMYLINEFFYWFGISKYNLPKTIKDTSIDLNNELSIGVLKGQFALDFYDSYVGKKMRLST